MSVKKSPKDLAKMLRYVLGRRPHEFALVPDAEGFVPVKALLQALGEEDGWKHVRENHLREILLSLPDPPVEMAGNRIRAAEREHLPQPEYEPDPPGLLFHCVRRRAWPHVREKGLLPTAETRVCLAAERETALRRGRRLDSEPVLVTVHTTSAQTRGAVFFRFGTGLYLVDAIPADCITGPPLPKVKEEPAPKKPVPTQKTPGSYILDLTGDKKEKEPGRRGRRQKKEPGWKKERRRNRRR